MIQITKRCMLKQLKAILIACDKKFNVANFSDIGERNHPKENNAK